MSSESDFVTAAERTRSPLERDERKPHPHLNPYFRLAELTAILKREELEHILGRRIW